MRYLFGKGLLSASLITVSFTIFATEPVDSCEALWNRAVIAEGASWFLTKELFEFMNDQEIFVGENRNRVIFSAEKTDSKSYFCDIGAVCDHQVVTNIKASYGNQQSKLMIVVTALKATFKQPNPGFVIHFQTDDVNPLSVDIVRNLAFTLSSSIGNPLYDNAKEIGVKYLLNHKKAYKTGRADIEKLENVDLKGLELKHDTMGFHRVEVLAYPKDILNQNGRSMGKETKNYLKFIYTKDDDDNNEGVEAPAPDLQRTF